MAACHSFKAISLEEADDKPTVYRLLLEQVNAVLTNEKDYVANCANVISVVYNGLIETRGNTATNWCGVYLVRPAAEQPSGSILCLGPFIGKPAVTRIPFENGVCGAAARGAKTVVVPDVHLFPGHIACDRYRTFLVCNRQFDYS